MRSARLVALAAIAMSFALLACQSPAPLQEAPPSAERAEQLERQGDAAGAARLYEALARENAGSTRIELAHRAARSWLRARLPGETERVLHEISGEARTPAQSLDRSLLGVEVLLARSRDTEAWQTLAALPEPASGPQRIRYLELRRRAAFAGGQPLEGVRAGMALEHVLPTLAERAAARASLLDELRAASERGMKIDPVRAQDPIARGWLELGPLAAIAARNPLGAARAVDAWRRRYPDHPAADIVRQELLSKEAATGKQGFEPAAHIALLLPVSGRMAGPAAAIRDGFLTAYYEAPAAARPRLRIYDTGVISIADAVMRATASGAGFIVGPLTREEVSAAADFSGNRPAMLALNFLPAGRAAPPQFYQFALSPEEEARQVAQRALAAGERRAVALIPEGDWGNRVLAAFREELLAGGGTLIAQTSYPTEGSDYSQWITQMLRLTESRARHRRLQEILGTRLSFEPRRRSDIDFIFAPGSFSVARLMRPQLRFHYAGDIPTYATSDAYEPDGQGLSDMDGLVFPDMPWMLGTGALAAQVRAEMQAAWDAGGPRHTRLFAFGYDAYRLVEALNVPRPATSLQLEGLTGRLSLDELGRVRRQLDWARLQGGQTRSLDAAPGT
ncbi:MAG: penicillin-binding protein activator [Gammaproteobacteria bacterium]|nr:penicillin-binding protein activator [Gammaproteobacteria bacterium]